jgi:hypothetical protein
LLWFTFAASVAGVIFSLISLVLLCYASQLALLALIIAIISGGTGTFLNWVAVFEHGITPLNFSTLQEQAVMLGIILCGLTIIVAPFIGWLFSRQFRPRRRLARWRREQREAEERFAHLQAQGYTLVRPDGRPFTREQARDTIAGFNTPALGENEWSSLLNRGPY